MTELNRILLLLEIDYLRKSKADHHRIWDPIDDDYDKYIAIKKWYQKQIADREVKLGMRP